MTKDNGNEKEKGKERKKDKGKHKNLQSQAKQPQVHRATADFCPVAYTQ